MLAPIVTENSWFAVNRVDDQAFASITGEVGVGTARAEDFIALCGDAEKIHLLIDSPGGDSFSAFELFRFLSTRNATTEIIGRACSAAGLIFLGGRHRRMASNATLMFHDCRVFCYGNTDKLLADACSLETYNRHISQIIQAATHLPASLTNQLLNGGDWYFTPEQAKKGKLCHEIFDPPAPATTSTRAAAPSACSVTEDEALVRDWLAAMGPITVANREKFTETLRHWLTFSVREAV